MGYRIGFTLIAIGFLGLGLARLRSGDVNPATVDPDYGHVPEFSLIDSSGRTVTLQDFSDKVWIADFIFTSCAGICPMMTGQMRKLQDELPPAVRFASFSVDPARDEPPVLAQYAQRFGADPQRWSFLTGDKQALYDLSIKGFKLALDDTQGSETEPITHSARFVLVDKAGRIRGYYSGSDDGELKKLVADAKKLL